MPASMGCCEDWGNAYQVLGPLWAHSMKLINCSPGGLLTVAEGPQMTLPISSPPFPPSFNQTLSELLVPVGLWASYDGWLTRHGLWMWSGTAHSLVGRLTHKLLALWRFLNYMKKLHWQCAWLPLVCQAWKEKKLSFLLKSISHSHNRRNPEICSRISLSSPPYSFSAASINGNARWQFNS